VSLSVDRETNRTEDEAQPPQFEYAPGGNAYEFGTMRPVQVHFSGQVVTRLPQRRAVRRRLGSG